MANMTIEQFRQVYDEWRQSGLTVQQFCENIGIREGRFYYWKAKLKSESLPVAYGGLIHLHGMLQVGAGRCPQVAEPLLHPHPQL